MLHINYSALLILCSSFSLLTACGSKDFKRSDPEATQLPLNSSKNQAVINEEPDTAAIEEIMLGEDEQGKQIVVLKKDPPKCVEKTIDFDRTADGQKISAGERIKDQYSAWGVKVEALNRRKKIEDVAITFDSSNPTGNDNDLATPGNGDGNTNPLGMLLIIPENLKDDNGDGLVDEPDDSSKGGALIFSFAPDTEVHAIDIIDIEENKSFVELYDAAGNVTQTDIPAKGNNSVQTLSWPDKPRLSQLKVHLDGSGAVDNIRICVSSIGKDK